MGHIDILKWHSSASDTVQPFEPDNYHAINAGDIITASAGLLVFPKNEKT
jgi:hypothetical protein